MSGVCANVQIIAVLLFFFFSFSFSLFSFDPALGTNSTPRNTISLRRGRQSRKGKAVG